MAMCEGGGVNRLFCFGLGYSAEALAKRLKRGGWQIAGTVRDTAKAARLRSEGYEVVPFPGPEDIAAVRPLLAGTTHVLLSIPPGSDGDPALIAFGETLAGLKTLAWIGYLSTVGVYGDHAGAWVDEDARLNATSARGKARIAAERSWLDFGERIGVATQVFRLAGIYGPGRSGLDKLREGTAHRIVKPGQVFSRIHVEDIASVLEASIAKPRQGAIYNVADNEPAPPQDVVTYGADLLGIAPPPEVPFESADLSPMARSFYADRRRISNVRIKSELGVQLSYPTYREGLKALA
jgi:nucleoside-diphosphate-sugar epimerase